jgi:glyoxylase I family protein
MSIEIRGMSPLLSVFDMPTSLAFYRDVLGFKVVHDSGQKDNSGWVMLQAGDATFMLNTAYDDDERPEVPDAATFAAHHDTCLYFGCPDPDAVYEYLREKGVELEPLEIAYYGMKQLYVSDPDNYNLCFQWPVKEENG